MPRTARLVAESGFYHVILRGNGKQLIFEDDADRSAFLEALASGAGDAGVSVLAWCLMENHVHVVLSDPDGTLSDVMHRLVGWYAQRFNRKTGHAGHVFESRFKSHPIESESYLLQAVRYVHENPASAGICAAADYPWSSYREYVGRQEAGQRVVADTALVLELVGGIEGFVAFSREGEPRSYRFNRRGRVPEGEVDDVAGLALGEVPAHEVKGLPRPERDALLLGLREIGLSVRQIERLTGIGSCTISRATNKLRRTRET